MATPIEATLELNTKAFNTGIKAANRSLALMGTSLTKVAGLATKTGLALAGATAAFGALAIAQNKSTAQLVDTADKLGLNIEFLQRMRYAADQTGVTVQTVDMALQRFGRRVGEAAVGTGEARDALREMGIELRDSQGNLRSTEDLLYDVSDAFAANTNANDRTRLAMRLFDSEGVSLVNTLAGGRDALKAMMQEADDLGAVLSERSARGAKDFDNSLTRLQTLGSGLFATISAALAPAMKQLVDFTVQFVQNAVLAQGGFEEFGRYLANELIDIVADVIIKFAEFYNKVIKAINQIIEAIRDNFIPALGAIIQTAKIIGAGFAVIFGIQMVAAIGKSITAIGLFGKALKRTGYGAIIAGLAYLGAQYLDLGDDVSDLEDQLKGLLPEGDALEPFNIENIRNGVSTFKKGLDDLDTGIEEVVVKAQRGLFPNLAAIGDALFGEDFTDKAIKSLENIQGEFGDTVRGMVADLDVLIGDIARGLELAGFGDATKTLQEGFVRAGMMLEDALTQAVLTGKANFKELGRFIMQTIVKSIIQKFITGPLLGMFDLPGKAMGGPVSAGKPYIVGERGPELFVPGGTGSIIPNHKLGMGGMGATQVNYNINAVDAMSFKQMVARDPEFIYSVSQAGARRMPR